ncbi:MAG: methyltransferase domain-containing protein [Pseudomonadota bacterium]|nr:methyltransferase domain-containing protein [Pseudomonadota bacterium]
MLPRVLEAETLDHLEPDDPAAQRSRRDLRRINRIMGAREILARALRGVGVERHRGPLRILEIGCGDGSLMLDVARRSGTAFGDAQLTLLDRQPIVSTDTIARYAEAGWRVETLVTDVLAWAADTQASRRWDLVVANLFLHHFEGDDLGQVLGAAALRADVFVACEPRRSRFALAASHLVGFIGANAVTRRDAVLSVRAGFVARDLSKAWPGAADAWQLDEYEDGLFTHCFCALRKPSRR